MFCGSIDDDDAFDSDTVRTGDATYLCSFGRTGDTLAFRAHYGRSVVKRSKLQERRCSFMTIAEVITKQ